MTGFHPADRIRVEWPLNDHDGRAGYITDTGPMPGGPFRGRPGCLVTYDDAQSRRPGAPNDHWIPERFLKHAGPAPDETTEEQP